MSLAKIGSIDEEQVYEGEVMHCIWDILDLMYLGMSKYRFPTISGKVMFNSVVGD